MSNQIITEYMEKVVAREPTTDKIPNVHYVKLKNGQLFRIQVEHVELCRLPTEEEEKIARNGGTEWSNGEYPYLY